MTPVTFPATGRRSTLTWLAPLLVLVLVVGLWWAATRDDPTDPAGGPAARASATASPSPATTTPDSGLGTIAESALPPQARDTLELIRAGGPYPYDQDDRTFQNRERLLPPRQRGYYREYTVETPGSDDRGARRIVAGSEGELYYTDDHYDSFRRISR